MNPLFMCRRRKALSWFTQHAEVLQASGSAAQHSCVFWPLQKKTSCFHSRQVAASLPPPGPASCLPGTEPLVPVALGPPGSREVGSVCCTKPHGLSDPNEESCFSLLGAVMSNFCCWGNVIGREPVEKDLSVKSGNGRIWKHLPMCTDGRAVAHKRLSFTVKLSNPVYSSALCLVHMTFFNPYTYMILGCSRSVI